jgi:hypothetical protein
MQDSTEEAETSGTPAGTMNEEGTGPTLDLPWTAVHTVRRKAAKRSEEWYRNGAGPLLIPARKKRRIEEPLLPLPAATDEVEISEGLASPAATLALRRYIILRQNEFGVTVLDEYTPPFNDLTQSPRQTQTQLKPIELREAQLNGDDDEWVFVPGALNDAPEMLASPNSSHEEREKELRDMLSGDSRKVNRRQLQISKKKSKRPYSPEEKERRRLSQRDTAFAYVAAGMNRYGYIKQSTRVCHDGLLPSAFHNHPFFHGIPHLSLKGTVQPVLLEQLRSIEREMRDMHRIQKYRYGANEGVNVGISVLTGGHFSDANKGILGSLHSADVVKDRPDLRKRIVDLFTEILEEFYGDQAWYKRLLCLTTQLNEETGECRTIPGLPLSGLWLTEKPNKERVHCDTNVVGATFLVTTSDVKGPTLCLSTPTRKLAKHDMKPGIILAGSWANYAHWNSKVDEGDEHPGNSRTSWTLYLDERVFCTKYKYIHP